MPTPIPPAVLETLEAIGGVAARLAHEINNPLAGIQYSFLLIKDAIPADHPHYGSVAAIERELARIASVTRQLYETYRPEKEVHHEASVVAVVGDAAAFLAQANATRVRIETDLGEAAGVVPVPPGVLRVIVYNLLQNAIELTPRGGTVRIAARLAGDLLTFRVSAADAPVVRDPSLALVRRIVTSAGGAITIDTSGGRAEFVASLPLNNNEASK
jgi:signal transduction histidine kinase